MSQTKKITSCKAISDAFLALHESAGFTILEPSSLLHSSVNTSFVMSAGLIQIENELDEIVEKTGGKFTFTQPCFRYFDMALAGKDSTHSSLFHMPAAFYIGSTQRDYILPRLWHFLINILKLEPKKLWITYLNEPTLGIDKESYTCWKEVGIESKHLIGLGRKHNFWQQRQSGKIAKDGKKCGPHTEIFYERTHVSCENCERSITLKNHCSCGRFVEISNSLFIENYVTDDEKLITIETVFSECVIGAERLAMILQDVETIHRIDQFSKWYNILQMYSNQAQLSKYNQAVDIIIDHLAAFVRLVKDGAPKPGRGGQARIMRTLARGAMTQAMLYNIDMKHILPLLLADHTQSSVVESLSRLNSELTCFTCTLERGKKQMIKMLNDSILTQEIKRELQQKWGIPEILAEKFYRTL